MLSFFSQIIAQKLGLRKKNIKKKIYIEIYQFGLRKLLDTGLVIF